MPRKHLVLASFVGLVSLGYVSPALAFNGGISSNSFGASGCNQCHSGGTAPGVVITGPTTVAPGATGTFVLDINTVPFQRDGGFNMRAPSGDFGLGGPNSSQTKLILNPTTNRNEVTHTSRKGDDDGHVKFSFTWKAPAGACTSVSLTGWGNAVSNSFGSSADRASQATLGITVCGQLGNACTVGAECQSGFCADGVCCNEACGGSAVDCRVCSAAKGAPANGTCGNASNGVVCRSSAGSCDAEETCNGGSGVCPADAKIPADTVCRGATDLCDAEEKCDGANNLCPADAKLPASTVCRPPSDLCDQADVCDGTSVLCPDQRLPTGAVCRPAAGDCDQAETCGANSVCPPDTVKSSAEVCRAKNGDCDVEEKCNGNAAACPTDAKLPANTVCRGAADLCDKAEVCDGQNGQCPGDTKQPANTVCRAAAGGCDAPEVCNGASNQCPADAKLPASTVCRAKNGDCDVEEKCDGSAATCPADVVLPANTVCRSSTGPCDPAEVCNGGSGQCPSNAFSPASTVCRAKNGACDVAETCPGNAAGCPADGFADSSTTCRNPSCTGSTETLGAKCPGNSTDCPPLATKECSPFICGANACTTSCVNSSNCAIGSFCDAGTCKIRFDNGEVCAAGGQCKSGSCVDGVCCNTACNGQCEACDVAGKLGTCSPVDGDPHGTRPACNGEGTLCGGSCNGVNALACVYPGAETSCRDASCASSVATLPASCNGSGACPAAQTQGCGAQGCEGVQCKGDCKSDQDCGSGDKFCSAGVCKDKLASGTVCSTATHCLSGSCVDGVCCNDACDGQCEACDVAGKLGTCSPVAGKPKNGRPACTTDGSLCGGTCDGTKPETCTYPAAETSCRDASCSSAQATLGAACDGKGACPALELKSCAPYSCEGPICGGGCTVESDCQLGFFCEAGTCAIKKGPGDACTTAQQCSSDYCVDGVCCDKPCKGQCEACNAQGNEGTCLPVVGEPQNGRPACAGDGPCVGSCNGANGVSCTFPGADTQCRDASCEDNVATLPAFCNSQGACPAKQTQLCSPFACSTTQCAGDCQIDGDCLNGTFCSAGVCTSKKVLGDACADGTQCASGFCADGVCCTSACEGQCEACNLPATSGTCSVILDGQPSPGKPACAGSGDCQGYCDGSSKTQCYFPTPKKLCSPVACDNNLYSAAAYCDGIGSCDSPKTSDCGAYSCGPGGCKVQCLTSDDCAEGFACNSDNTCKPIPGAGGAGGDGGAGQAGDGGAAGSAAGKAGDGGTGVVAGTGGAGGQGGAGKGGTGGTGGSGGAAGEAGKGGQAAPPNADFDPGSEGGCGCRTAGSSAPSSSPLALGALGLAAALIRRRRRAALRIAPPHRPRFDRPWPRFDRPRPRRYSRRGVRVSTGSPGYRA